MQYLLSAEEMKRADQNTIETFLIPSIVLMERAALKVVETIEREHLQAKKTLVVCGTGNNGGDGMAVARMLYLAGNQVRTCLIGKYEKCSKETKQQYAVLKAYGMEITEGLPEDYTEDVTLVVDALFGIGLSREVTGGYKAAIERMNRICAEKLAVDIPSGIHADSGAVMGCCFYADHTVTFAYNKTGLRLYPGAAAAGKICVADIGITEESFLGQNPKVFALEERDCDVLPKRRPEVNKGSCGKVLVIAGNEEMAGAAYFSAKAAYLTGCGLVKVFTHEKNRTMLNEKVPEAVLVTYGGEREEQEWKEALLKAVAWADVIVIGPGLGTSDRAENILKYTLEYASVPITADADALNLIARNPKLLDGKHTELIVTPHLGEMSRLTELPVEDLKKNLISAAQEFSKAHQVICVEKDARTIVSAPNGRTYVNLSGNPGMATAGSGDVLSGMIAGLLAGGMSAESAAAMGVFLHGRSGDVMAEKTGYYSLMAGDILEGIKEVMR